MTANSLYSGHPPIVVSSEDLQELLAVKMNKKEIGKRLPNGTNSIASIMFSRRVWSSLKLEVFSLIACNSAQFITESFSIVSDSRSLKLPFIAFSM